MGCKGYSSPRLWIPICQWGIPYEEVTCLVFLMDLWMFHIDELAYIFYAPKTLNWHVSREGNESWGCKEMNIIAHTQVYNKLKCIINLFYIILSIWNWNEILFDEINVNILFNTLLYYIIQSFHFIIHISHYYYSLGGLNKLLCLTFKYLYHPSIFTYSCEYIHSIIHSYIYPYVFIPFYIHTLSHMYK